MYDREVYRAWDDSPRRLLNSGLSLTKVQVCKSFTRSSFCRVENPYCMCDVWYKPVFSDKEKYPQSSLRDARPCFLCKVDHDYSLQVNTSNQPLSPPIISALTLRLLCCPNKKKNGVMIWVGFLWLGWSPVSHVRSKKNCSPLFFNFKSCFLAMQYPREKLNSLQTPYQGVLRYYWTLLCYRHLTLLCRKRDLVCDGLLTCANNVWNDCVVPIWPHTQASWEIYIFVFQYSCTFIDIAV